MSAALHMRPATVHYLDMILYHRRRMFQDMGEPERASPERLEAFGIWVEAQMAAGCFYTWLIEDDGRVVAGGSVRLMDAVPGYVGDVRPNAHILNVYTEPSYRRRGLARWLMQTMIDWSRDYGVQAITLKASADGRALYESLGFVPTTDTELR